MVVSPHHGPLDCICWCSWPGSVCFRDEYMSDSNWTQTVPAFSTVATFQIHKHSALCLKRWHVLSFKAHLHQLHKSALWSAELPLSQCSYSLVFTVLTHL